MSDKSGTESNYSDHLKREVVTTEDGSSSISIPGMNEMYHSRKGAVKESQHVYIQNGLLIGQKKHLDVLEIGMGTGLNVLLSLVASGQHGMTLHYTTLEPYPLQENEWTKLNYASMLGIHPEIWKELHSASENVEINLTESFTVRKLYKKLEDFESGQRFDVVYFDAFAPSKQSGPWVMENIQKAYDLLKPGGLLTTYCSQGQFKRNLAQAGFRVTNPEGPMGKREITVAYK